MANDINDDAELIPNHAEAWNLAHYRRGTSNLERAYIELRETCAKLEAHQPTFGHDAMKLRAIIHSNDI